MSRLLARTLSGIFAACCFFFCGLAPLPVPAYGQSSPSAQDDELLSVIVLARHGVRAPLDSELRSGAYNAQPWPSWPVAKGVLTPHGAEALRLLGAYYRSRYPTLLQHLSCDRPDIYVEANTTQRTIASARAMLSGLAPECPIPVHFLPHGHNPLFSPAEGTQVNDQELIDSVNGKMADEPDWFTHAFARPLAEMHRVLTDCGGSDCDRSKPDFRTTAVNNGVSFRRNGRLESPVALGADFAENFLLEYTEGMPMHEVGWGRVSRQELDDLMEMNTRYHDFMLRTPYGDQVAASDLAAHIRDTILALSGKDAAPGRLGMAQDRFFLLDGHDANLTWLGGLLRLNWLLPDQTFNATPPGSALVFELHRSRMTGERTVRVLFISQTLDQIRSLQPLHGTHQPSVAPVFVPGCSGPAPVYACTVDAFARIVTTAINPRFVRSDKRDNSTRKISPSSSGRQTFSGRMQF